MGPRRSERDRNENHPLSEISLDDIEGEYRDKFKRKIVSTTGLSNLHKHRYITNRSEWEERRKALWNNWVNNRNYYSIIFRRQSGGKEKKETANYFIV